MIQFNGQNNIKEIHYNNQNIKAVYDYQGKIWPSSNAEDLYAGFDGLYLLKLSDDTIISADCSTYSTEINGSLLDKLQKQYSGTCVDFVIGGCCEKFHYGLNVYRFPLLERIIFTREVPPQMLWHCVGHGMSMYDIIWSCKAPLIHLPSDMPLYCPCDSIEAYKVAWEPYAEHFLCNNS